MEKYTKIITDDGTISFYNNEIGDIYHSKVGAYTEAFEKFVKPSGVLENLHNYQCINVLDVCFGLGYNSKVLTSSILKHDKNKQINLTAIEIDPEILLKGCDISFDGYQDHLKNFFDTFLHKVYYSTVSDEYNKAAFFEANHDSVYLKVFVDDARQIVKELEGSYDLILLDPFSPQKLPCLWTVDLFKHLYRLIATNGQLITYSSAYSVRGGLLEAGFAIENSLAVGRNAPGTIAVKDSDLIVNPLTLKQLKILSSRAGIPFEDPNLNWTNDQIIKYREHKQSISSRIAASKVRREK